MIYYYKKKEQQKAKLDSRENKKYKIAKKQLHSMPSIEER